MRARAGEPDGVTVGSRWAERTLSDVNATARELTAQERWANSDGFLQRRDARAKWLATLVLLVGVALLHGLPSLTAAAVIPLAAAAATRLPPALLLRRALTLSLPFSTLLILIVLCAPWAGGPKMALQLFLRTAASVSLSLLLVLTTRWRDLTNGLRGLGVGSLFIEVLEQTRRYLFHLPLTAQEMVQARRARSVGPVAHSDARRYVGFSTGVLLGKAHARAEASHQALLARGYRGSAVVAVGAERRKTLRPADFALFAGAVLLTLILWEMDRMG